MPSQEAELLTAGLQRPAVVEMVVSGVFLNILKTFRNHHDRKNYRYIARLKNMTSLRINNKDFVADEIGLQKSNAFVKFIRKIGCAPSPDRFQMFFHPVYVRECFGPVSR